MVSGSRGIIRCKSAVSTTLRASSHEPLLFLYPTWARTIASSSAQVAPAVGQPKLDNVYYGAKDAQPLQMRAETRQRELRPATQSTGPDIRQPRIEPQPVSDSSPTQGGIRSKSESGVDEYNGETGPRPLPRRNVGGIKVKRVLRHLEKTSRKHGYDQERRNQYFEQAREEREAREPKPARIMEDLTEITTQRTSARSTINVLVSEDAVPQLLFGLEENIVEIRHRTGCHIELLETEDNCDTRTLRVNGPAVCVAAAAADISAVRNASSTDQRFFIPSTFSTKRGQRTAEGSVIPDYYVSREKSVTTPKRADAIRQPQIWTSKNLHSYVLSLTRIKMTNQMHRIFYGPGEEHQRVVESLLEDLFESDKCLEVMSAATLNEGLAYFTRVNQLTAVRDIFGKLQLRGFRMSTETYNIMLRKAAKIHDLGTCSSLIRSMASRGYRADSSTWLTFLAALDEPKAAAKVVAAMRERGLFYEEGVLAKACEVLAPLELQTRLDDDEPCLASDFISYMEQTLGEKWLNQDAANKLLQVLASRGLTSECWFLLEYMSQRHILPDVVSGNTILDKCWKFISFDTGLNLFERLVTMYNFEPDEVTWSIMSKHAWESKYYATSRTIWRYACLDGSVSASMRRRIIRSLAASLATAHDGSEKRISTWTTTTAPFVITKAAKLTFANPEGNILDKQGALSLASHAVKADEEQFLTYELAPGQELISLLRQSVEADLALEYDPLLQSKLAEKKMKKVFQYLNKNAPEVKRQARTYLIELRSKPPLRSILHAAPAKVEEEVTEAVEPEMEERSLVRRTISSPALPLRRVSGFPASPTHKTSGFRLRKVNYAPRVAPRRRPAEAEAARRKARDLAGFKKETAAKQAAKCVLLVPARIAEIETTSTVATTADLDAAELVVHSEKLMNRKRRKREIKLASAPKVKRTERWRRRRLYGRKLFLAQQNELEAPK